MPGGVKVKVEELEGPDKQSGGSKQCWLSKVRCYKCQGLGHLRETVLR